MTPSLEISRSAAGGAALNVPPPRFRPLGRISCVVLQPREYVRMQGVTDAQEAGLRYESQVQKYMTAQFPKYLSGSILTMLDDQVYRSLCPDGLLIHPDRVFIFEIKYGHCPEAWWQLEKLYKVALARLYHCPISLVEVCRSYDPAMPFPVPVTLISDLEDWVSQPRDDFGVYVWRKTSS